MGLIIKVISALFLLVLVVFGLPIVGLALLFFLPLGILLLFPLAFFIVVCLKGLERR